MLQYFCHHLYRSVILRWPQQPLLTGCCSGWFVRCISTELTTALRPFYFAVHPDLFGQHPKQRSVNEDSLKQLSAHMESLYERKYHVLHESKTLQFYIRDAASDSRNTFKLIKITLDRHMKDPKTIIQHLLELCNLPTDYIKSIKSIALSSPSSPGDHMTSPASPSDLNDFKAGGEYTYGSEFTDFSRNFRRAKEENKRTLETWLASIAPIARVRSEELADLKEEVDKLQKTVVKRLNLRDVRYDCGWNYEHYRGCLKTLERLVNLDEKHLSALRDRIVVFAPFTGVSLEGHVMLFTGDVLNNWIDFIKNIPEHDKFLRKIPLYESTLSQVLRKIKIGRRKFMPKQQAVEYAGHLMKVTTTLGDYLTINKYPKQWPDTLEDYEIVIESEAGPLMVNPTGQLIAPATCPGFMLIDFITTNLDLAKERTEKYKKQKNVEKDLVERSKRELKLWSLTKDDSVTPDKMIDALGKLLLTHNKNDFEGISLHIANYYSVLTDGIVCIPWDFSSKEPNDYRP